MPKQWTDQFSFNTGTVRLKDLAYAIMVSDEMQEEKTPHFSLMEWDAGTWRDGGRLEWNCTTCTVLRAAKEQILAVGEFGQALLMGSGDKHEEQITTADSSPEDRGPLRCVRYIGSHAYVVGMDRQAYRRDGLNRWSAIDQGMRPPADAEDVVGLETVDGFSDKEIYAAGWEGEIWRYDGKRWKEVDSPTNVVLTALACGGDKVYVGGQTGILLEGRNESWQVIEQDRVEDDIWGMAWYGNELYFSTMDAVYRLRNGEIQLVEMGKDQPETCYHLSAADGVLWSIGNKDIMAFDGKRWTRIE